MTEKITQNQHQAATIIAEYLHLQDSICVDMAAFMVASGTLLKKYGNKDNEIDPAFAAKLLVACVAREGGMSKRGAAAFASNVDLAPLFKPDYRGNGPILAIKIGPSELSVRLPLDVPTLLQNFSSAPLRFSATS